MRKIISILGTVVLTAATSTSIMACGGEKVQSPIQKTDISNNIPNALTLGTLSATTVNAFKTALQTQLKTIPELSTITSSDYNVYNANTNTSILNSDITTNTSLFIKIVANSTSTEFTGTKDNIIARYNRKKIIAKENTIYIDENGNQQTTNEIDLSNLDTTEIIQIGFYENENGEIQVVKMPKTIIKVPNNLPKKITSLAFMFDESSSFNQDLSTWDTSNITDTSYMFYEASAFNQNISNWNTSNVINMSGMFLSASIFNQDISTWNTSKVTNMSGMFFDASVFNQNISTWDTSNVTDMSYMFFKTSRFNQDLSKWKVDNVKKHSIFTSYSRFARYKNKWPKFK